MQLVIWIIIGVAVLVLFSIGGVYNRFVSLRNSIESTFKQISVALKKRLDMIGQLVDSTKGQMKFEKGTLTEVTKMRTQMGKGQLSPQEAKDAMAATDKLMGSIMVTVENYPNLKSNENVKQLMDAIRGVEDEVSRLRYTYNNVIQEFNTKTESFPTNIIAGMFGFKKTEYLAFEESTAELNKKPKIDL